MVGLSHRMNQREFQKLLNDTTYEGSSADVVSLSIGIHEASQVLDGKTFRQCRDTSPINDKVFSKLKVIGKTLSAVPAAELKAVVAGLPDSYSTIHVLCGLSPQELVTAVKSKAFSSDLTVRAAKDYLKKVRFPALAGQVQVASTAQESIFGVFQDQEAPLSPADLTSLEAALKEVCGRFGVEVRQQKTTTISTLRKQDRADREVFWRNALEEELPLQWFTDTDQEVRKQFNLKTVEELYNTPLRQFTGFLIRTSGGRTVFWELFGRAYVCKLHMEQEKTNDKTQRHNWKRRLMEVFDDDKKGGRDLAVWNNKMLKGGGFV